MRYFGFDKMIGRFQTFGVSESAVKATANFLTGEYSKSGSASTFNELFLFNRASTAWLYKDNTLNTYATDVPRFRDGLVIEKESTNKLVSSRVSPAWVNSYTTEPLKHPSPYGGANVDWQIYDGTTFKTLRLPLIDYVLDVPVTLTMVIRTDTNVQLVPSGIGVGLSDINTLDNIFSYAPEILEAKQEYLNAEWVKISLYFKSSSTVKTYGFQFIHKIVNKGFGIAHIQLEDGRGTSPIITTGTVVTRKADVLKSNIIATSVTGDWDSTLSLSVVDGQLVHSGYGYIRSLVIQ